MVHYSEHIIGYEHFTDFMSLLLLKELQYILNSKHSDVKIAFFKCLNMLFEVLGCISFRPIKLVVDQFHDRFNLGIFLELWKEHELDIFVAFQTLLLLVLNVEFKDLLDVPLDLLSVRVHLVGLNYDRKEWAEIVDGLLHPYGVQQKLEAKDA